MSKLILMSIKTKYAKEIFNGTKKYEYRRKSIGEKNLNNKIYIYSSQEEKAIIGYIIIDKILEGDINYILNETNNLNNKDIIDYFECSSKCFALQIKEYVKLDNLIKLDDIKKIDRSFNVPQFYRYIKENEYLYKLLK